MSAAWLGLLVILGVASPAPPTGEPTATTDPSTPPDDPVAAAPWYFERERWREAADAFGAAYAAEGDPRYLYARAQALRLDGRCAEAIEDYQRYLEFATGAETRRKTLANLSRCRAQLEAAGGEAEVRPAAPVPPAVGPADAAPTLPVRSPDRLGIALTASGAGALLAGAVVTVLGGVGRLRADAVSADEDEFDRRLRRSTIELGTGVAVAVVGAALVTAGAVRLARSGRSTARSVGSRVSVGFVGGALRF